MERKLTPVEMTPKRLPNMIRDVLTVMAEAGSPIRPITPSMQSAAHRAWLMDLAKRQWKDGEAGVYYQITEHGRACLASGLVQDTEHKAAAREKAKRDLAVRTEQARFAVASMKLLAALAKPVSP